ncbi:MAG: thiol:disulfide interchange protein DsbA/DsbL [Magnetococcales bacterium]|nr:thiol:disulfide interchange protein DsbA/DsbL [Magnetococcales bacterium]MBF0155801.1 thiol:disulfide interchange protein DsbA/DsbL [Magnetococcales bacterium]
MKVKLASLPKGILTIALVALLFALAPAAFAADPVAGTDYDVIQPPVPRLADRPEIVEIFNFKCPHCRDLHPTMVEWAKSRADRYLVSAMPIHWGEQTDLPARAFFAAGFMGKGEEMRQAIFAAHFDRQADIENMADLLFLVEDLGLDQKKFSAAMESFGVTAKATQAMTLAKAFGVTGTPLLVVNGKYRVSLTHAKGDPKRLVAIADFLATR